MEQHGLDVLASLTFFVLLEMNSCASEECTWVEVLPVMFRPGYLKAVESLRGPTKRNLFQV